ncbi:MAG: hypothetical protein V4721_00485 [Bacteroidota bacterium]
MEMVIGLPIKKGEDVFKRDEEGNIIGQAATEVAFKKENPQELKIRKQRHDERVANMKANAYREAREAEYPDAGELADMLFWRIDRIVKTGGESTLCEQEVAWYRKCKVVKEKHPKP